MNRLLSTFILVMALTLGAQAQGTGIGVKAGVNFATIDGKDIDNSEFVWGYNVGMLLQLPITEGVIIQPEALFSLKGTGDTGTEDNLTTMYVEIPVMAKVMLGEAFNLQFGPYAGFMINSKKGNDNLEDALNGFDAGVGLGLGYNIGRILIDARYMYGLTDVYKEDVVSAVGIPAGEGGNRVIQLSLGYKIFGEN